jgi:thiol-disulfide isomerase/thioredoxin
MCAKRCIVMAGTTAGGAAAFCGIARRAGILSLAALAVALTTGCGAAPPTPPAVRLELVDHAELLARVAAHRGKVVVLDCWSTSCPPCVREFPGLVRLAAAHPDAVACLSLSFDYEGIGSVEAAAGPVREFLRSVDAGAVENLLSREEADAMYAKLELDSVPAVYVWKPDGSLARRFDDDDAKRRLGRAFTYADVAAEVRACLAQ